ncbi:TlpA family protein disulfide reductase [Orrella sp. 11846]|uniref:TlpA family protein disulfide reductase n=1 Tax=Orrella sp. 11846 TaxID=3409913 RepID=UPI003B592E76
MKKVISTLVVLCLIGAGAWFFFAPKQQAPAVVFHTLDDQSIAMDDLKGRVVLVKFWATSCVTCVKQMPDTTELYEALSPEGFDVIAVAMAYDPEDYVKQFTATRKLPFTVAMDRSGEVARAFDDVRLTPTAFLIDKNGAILKKYLGNYDKQELRRTVETALAS